MRILFVGINYWPEQTGIAPVITWRAEALAARGHQVSICTGFPYYPQWRVAEGYRGRWWQRETHNNVEVLRSWLWAPRRVSSAKRVVHEASFLATSAVRAFGAGRPDLLVAVSPPLGLGITAIALARWWNIPYIFDVMDLQPDAAAELGMMPAPALKFLYKLEHAAYRHAALVTTLTAGIQKRIVEKGIPADRVGVIPLAAASELFRLRNQHDDSAFRRAFGLGDKFLIVHAGNMGVKQGLEVILGSARNTASRRDIMYVVVGDGARRQALQDQAASFGLSNLLILPLQPKDIFEDLLATTDVALVTQQCSVSDIVFPSKVVTLLAAGCPVIASVNDASEIARVIGESRAGLVVRPDTSEELANAVLRLCDDPATRRAMSARGREYASAHWAADKVVGQMESELVKAAAYGAPTLVRAATDAVQVK